MTRNGMAEYTHEILFGGALRMKQRVNGYRYTIDPVLLAHFITPGLRDRVLDIGTGSGILPMILAHRHPEITLAGIEIQPRLAGTAMENIRDNHLENRVSIISGDVLDLPGRDFPLQDLVLSNPPFTPYGKGRINPSDEKAMARHEIRLTLETLVTTAASLLTKVGRFAVIYPESRCGELLACLERHGLAPVRLRRVHPLAGGPAKRVLVEAAKGGRYSLTVEPSLTIYSEKEIFSDDVKNMFL